MNLPCAGLPRHQPWLRPGHRPGRRCRFGRLRDASVRSICIFIPRGSLFSRRGRLSEISCCGFLCGHRSAGRSLSGKTWRAGYAASGSDVSGTRNRPPVPRLLTFGHTVHIMFLSHCRRCFILLRFFENKTIQDKNFIN